MPKNIILAVSISMLILTSISIWKFLFNSEDQRQDFTYRKETVQSKLVKFQNNHRTTSKEKISTKSGDGDFSAALSQLPEARPILKFITQQAIKQNIVLLDLQAQDHAATASDLARTEISLHVRGGYVALKSLVAQTLLQHPEVTVRRWDMQRTATAPNGTTSPPPISHPQIESTLVLSAWGRPVLPAADTLSPTRH